MAAGRRVLLPLSFLVVGCGSREPAPLTPVPVPSASVAVVTTPPEAADDPRLVRCGVDDRPRSVVGERPRAVSSEERALFGDRAAPEPVATRAPPAPGAPLRRPPVPSPLPRQEADTAPIQPAPAVTIDRGSPRRADGAPLASTIADALQRAPIGLEACEDLMQDSDEGDHALLVELASSGAPLSVREAATTAAPSRLVRCAMERACQLKSPAGDPLRIVLPLRVHSMAASVPLPPTAAPATAMMVVDVVLAGAGASSDPGATRFRAEVRRIAGACGGTRSVTRGTKVRVILTSAASRPAGTPPEIRTQMLQGTSTNDLVSCLVAGIGALPPLATGRGAQTIDVTFLP